MKNMRRTLAVLLVLSAQLVLFSSAQISSKAAASSQYLAYVGTYTTKTNSKGMYVFRFDATTGKLSAIGIAAETRDPSWVAVHPNGKFLYAANEAGKSSTVSAFAIDAKSGKLTLLNQLPALGEDPCYLSFDKTGKYVFVANYSSGNVVVFPIGPDGRLMYVLGELQSTVTVFANDARETYRSVQQTSTLPKGFSGRNDTAEIATHPNGKFLYASNRGHDSIAIFAIDPAKGTLTFVAHVPTGGKEPRHFAIDPIGKYLLAENQFSNKIVVLKISAPTGSLTPTGQVVEVPSPVDIAFFPGE